MPNPLGRSPVRESLVLVTAAYAAMALFGQGSRGGFSRALPAAEPVGCYTWAMKLPHFTLRDWLIAFVLCTVGIHRNLWVFACGFAVVVVAG